jgi:hypothetical protein
MFVTTARRPASLTSSFPPVVRNRPLAAPVRGTAIETTGCVEAKAIPCRVGSGCLSTAYRLVTNRCCLTRGRVSRSCLKPLEG